MTSWIFATLTARDKNLPNFQPQNPKNEHPPNYGTDFEWLLVGLWLVVLLHFSRGVVVLLGHKNRPFLLFIVSEHHDWSKITSITVIVDQDTSSKLRRRKHTNNEKANTKQPQERSTLRRSNGGNQQKCKPNITHRILCRSYPQSNTAQ